MYQKIIRINIGDTWSSNHSNFNNTEFEENLGSLSVFYCTYCGAGINIKIYTSYITEVTNIYY